MSKIPGFLTIQEAADRLKVSHSQAARYVRSELLKAKDLGNQYLIPEQAVADFQRPEKGNPAFRTINNPAIQAAKKKNRKSS